MWTRTNKRRTAFLTQLCLTLIIQKEVILRLDKVTFITIVILCQDLNYTKKGEVKPAKHLNTRQSIKKDNKGWWIKKNLMERTYVLNMGIKVKIDPLSAHLISTQWEIAYRWICKSKSTFKAIWWTKTNNTMCSIKAQYFRTSKTFSWTKITLNPTFLKNSSGQTQKLKKLTDRIKISVINKANYSFWTRNLTYPLAKNFKITQINWLRFFKEPPRKSKVRIPHLSQGFRIKILGRKNKT